MFHEILKQELMNLFFIIRRPGVRLVDRKVILRTTSNKR